MAPGPMLSSGCWPRSWAHPNLRHLRFHQPLGFARSVNAGVAAALGEFVIVLNSDTIVTTKWMDELYDGLAADLSLGALTPCTNDAGELLEWTSPRWTSPQPRH